MAQEVSLVIPGRNAEKTAAMCLESVVPLLELGLLDEIIFVDDGSTDATAAIVDRYPVRRIQGEGKGAGAARNLGWRAASSPLIWFIDSDCVAEPHALELLLETWDRSGLSELAGVGGSYGNMRPDSVLACLIHEEIISRHRKMEEEVNFLATFNVIYSREILDKVGGFDERFLLGQDAELSWRIRRTGARLGFDIRSRVKHFHPHQLKSYLRTQARHGYWRAWLYLDYPHHMGGDSYSGVLDHLQPVLALSSLASLGLVPFGLPLSLPALCGLALAVIQIPLVNEIGRQAGFKLSVQFFMMNFVRAYARGFGLAAGTLSVFAKRVRRLAGKRERE